MPECAKIIIKVRKVRNPSRNQAESNRNPAEITPNPGNESQKPKASRNPAEIKPNQVSQAIKANKPAQAKPASCRKLASSPAKPSQAKPAEQRSQPIVCELASAALRPPARKARPRTASLGGAGRPLCPAGPRPGHLGFPKISQIFQHFH